MRIAVIGGGPGGLYLGRLVKREWPDAVVDVFEQNTPEATFGFGVTLGANALDKLSMVDPEFARRVSEHVTLNQLQNISLNGQDILVEYESAGGSITRVTLLNILHQLCLDVGVTLHSERRIEDTRELKDYDLIVGADGANSVVRRERENLFGTRQRLLDNRFAWYGVNRAMAPSALVFRSALGGAFIAHYYPYTSTMSTFVAECDKAAWINGGMDAMTDDQRRAVTEEVFEKELEGQPLVENRSIWRQFPVITNDRWFHGKTVLIGDALRVAHPSIGSGTRLAMDDAQSLFEALRETPDVKTALPLFVERRSPGRDKLANAAERSFEWYDQVAVAMNRLPIDFVYDFLTRTGRIDHERLATYAPSFARLYRERRLRQEDRLDVGSRPGAGMHAA